MNDDYYEFVRKFVDESYKNWDLHNTVKDSEVQNDVCNAIRDAFVRGMCQGARKVNEDFVKEALLEEAKLTY